jgi:hypothetical protein
MVLLPLTYLGPVQLYCRYYESTEIIIEQNDTYQKQSYRNRCDIYGANGRLSLSIPVKHDREKRLKVKEIKIDYATDWRRIHWKGIVSAYNSSPYFEYYRDIFEIYYTNEFFYLIDLCLRLNEEVLKILGISNFPELTNDFYPSPTPVAAGKAFPDVTPLKLQLHAEGEGVSQRKGRNLLDLRGLIHPKINFEADGGFGVVEYSQVFLRTHGFIPNLSILDLIFNMGPEARRILSSCLR